MAITDSCGSDLGVYEGRTDVEQGKVLGPANVGRVIEVGSVVDGVKVGAWVVSPVDIGCRREVVQPWAAQPDPFGRDQPGPDRLP